MKPEIVHVVSVIVLGFLLVSLWGACRVPGLDQLNHTRQEPNKSDLVGTWVLGTSSLRTMHSEGGYDASMRPRLTLRVDDTFELVNMPDWWDTGSGKSHQAFQDYSGVWGLSKYGSTGVWNVYLKFSSKTRSASLLGQRPPYRIEFIIGDPDSNVSMIFEKT